MRRAPLRLVLALAVALAGSSCGDDGRELRPPPPDATIAPRTSSTTVAPPVASTPATPDMRLASPAFRSGDRLPDEYTCDGAGQRPELTWLDVPTDTQELAIVVRRSGEEIPLWVVTGLDPASPGLSAGALPARAVEHPRADGAADWPPPCVTDPGAETANYEFVLYALTEPAALTTVNNATDAATTVSVRATVQATLAAFYP